MDGASPTAPQAQSRASAMAWFKFLRENPTVKSQLPSRARLERRASRGTYKGGADAAGNRQASWHQARVCIFLTCFGSGSCLRAFQIDGRSTGRSVWMKPEILLLIPGKTSNGCKSYRRTCIMSRTFLTNTHFQISQTNSNKASHTHDVMGNDFPLINTDDTDFWPKSAIPLVENHHFLLHRKKTR